MDKPDNPMGNIGKFFSGMMPKEEAVPTARKLKKAKEAAGRGYKFGVFWDYCACAAAPSNLQPNAPHRLSP